MTLGAYNVSGNSWSATSQPGGFDHNKGIATPATTPGTYMFLMFGDSGPSKSIVLARGGMAPISWMNFPNPPTGSDYSSASIATTWRDDVYVFGGSAITSTDTWGSGKLRISSNVNSIRAWRTGMSSPTAIFGQAAFADVSGYGLLFLAAGRTAVTGAYQQHQYYNTEAEAYVATAARAWTTSGGYRHASRARINWMT